MAHREIGSYGTGLDGYLYLGDAGAKLVGLSDGSVTIPATTSANADENYFVAVLKKGGASGLPAAVKAKDIYVHKGSETVLAEGDEVFVIQTSDANSYPATSITFSAERSFLDAITQKNFGNTVSIPTGIITYSDFVVNGLAEKGNEFQDKIRLTTSPRIEVAADGTVSRVEREPLLVIGFAARFDGQQDVDFGKAVLLEPAGSNDDLQQDGIQEFPITFKVSQLANPTDIKIAKGA